MKSDFTTFYLKKTLAMLIDHYYRSIINEIKISLNKGIKPKIASEVLQNLEEYLDRCGIFEPFNKIYVKNIQEFINIDVGRIMAALLITQVSKLQICYTTGMLL